MNDTGRQQGWKLRGRRLLLYFAVAVLAFLALISISLKLYLSTGDPARRLSALLSGRLDRQVEVQLLHPSPGGISLMGLSVADPPGFAGGRLLTVRSLTIRPDWPGLILGRRDIALVEVDGVRLDLHRNGAGAWNFSGLVKPGKGAPAAETVVRRLRLRDGLVSLGGRSLGEISLDVRDLATGGSLESRMELEFADWGGNRYRLSGRGRGGSDPSFAAELRGAYLDLAPLAPPKIAQYLGRSRGELRLTATLQKGELHGEGELGVSRPGRGGRQAANGRLRFRGGYLLQDDLADLESLVLAVEGLPLVHASGRVQGVRGRREFDLSLQAGELELGRLARLLPAFGEGKAELGGRFAGGSIRVSGSAAGGVRSVAGAARLRDISLKQGGRPWLGGLACDMALARRGDAILLKGERAAGGEGGALLQSLRAPFELILSSKLVPGKGSLTLTQARVAGLTLTGLAGLDRSAAEPFRANLKGRLGDPAGLNPLLAPWGVRLGSGEGSASLTVAARGKDDLGGTLDLTLAGVQGERSKRAASLARGGFSARFSRSAGKLAAAGELQLLGIAAAGEVGSARLRYRLADRLLTLEEIGLEWAGSRVAIASTRGTLPTAQALEGRGRYPLEAALEGGEMVRGGHEISGLSARLNGFLVRDGANRWLEGSAEVSGGRLLRRGVPLAEPLARVSFARSGARVGIGGTLLKGGVEGQASFDPFSPASGGSFSLAVRGAELTAASPLLPAKAAMAITEGLLDLSLEGRYAQGSGVDARVEAKGTGVTLAKGGRTILSRAGLTLAGSVSRERLSVARARLAAGEGVIVSAEGGMEKPFSPGRRGSFRLRLAEAPLDSFVTTFINAMPRPVQEATVTGTLAAEATIDLEGERRLLQGALLLGGIGLDSPGQGLDLSGMKGRVPFSLDLSARGKSVGRSRFDFTRENFATLYGALGSLPERGEKVEIDRVSLGRVELGPLKLCIRGEEGVTEIVSMKSPLMGGSLLGTGSVYLKEGLRYRGDLLLGGLSLTELCSRFPGIGGYISGRVNGIVSIYGEGGGLSRLYGFVDLWADEVGGEKMQVSREFLQRLGGKKLSGIFFRSSLPYDRAEIGATLERGELTFDTLDIVHTNAFGVRDLSVAIAPSQNRIALDHLIESVKQASASGKGGVTKGRAKAEEPPQEEFRWEE